MLIGWGSQLLSSVVPGIGSTTLAILLGIVVGNFTVGISSLKGGAVFSEKKILPLAIALLGVQLRFQDFVNMGIPSLIIVLTVVPLVIIMGIFVGKLFGLSPLRSLLLGSGNAICGSSAIASVGRVVEASEEDMGLSVAAVNFMGTLGLFLLPFLARLIGLGKTESGVWLGASLQAVGHVVAAGYGMGEDVGSMAVLIKMGRVLLLGPAVIIIGFLYNRGGAGPARKKSFPIPIFILGFFLASTLASFAPIDETVLFGVQRLGKFLLTMAMAGVGMKILFRSLIKQGPRVLLAEITTAVLQIGAVLLLLLLLF